jgi:hypothetical protein
LAGRYRLYFLLADLARMMGGISLGTF